MNHQQAITQDKPFDYVVGIVGHPTTPDVAWSDEQLATLKDVGVNTLQMSIAWAWKPAGEVLNLEDFADPKNTAEWQRRLQQAHKFGFRTLAHFGLPMGPQSDATTCILDPAVRQNYASRLQGFFHDFAGVDDVMIYTYDQLAWLCSEFGDCPRCHGIPLHERLTPFLEAMADAVQSAKPGARLWWEPWELSAGQTYAIANAIRPDHFGLILHHTIAEVQFVNQTDLWFRNLARLAGARGIPVIGEGFFGGSGEDVSPLTHLACPRLVYQELNALRTASGVAGIKEYYGLAPAHFSVNVAMLAAFLKNPDTPLSALLPSLADIYGAAVRGVLLEAWELLAQAMEFFPWDASWALRRIFETKGPVTLQAVPNASWLTPSWQANRRGFYMVTDDKQQHPWLREDVALRAQFAAQRFEQSAALLAQAAEMATERQVDLRRQRDDADLAARTSASLAASLFARLRSEESEST
jgi:hypothetical protein